MDTAIVGHLGTPEPGAVAIAGVLLTTGITLCNLLIYGTTARLARLPSAGEGEAAGSVGAGALGAHQVAFQLFISLALILDAIAIAGQIIVGRSLGRGTPRGRTGRRCA